jgi:DNA polymerase-1
MKPDNSDEWRGALGDLPFAELWCVDFEFCAEPGDRPIPVCLTALELRTARRIRVWQDEFGNAPPYPIDRDALFIAYYASAELGCHLALGWPIPENVLDLFAEFRNSTNGIATVSGVSLLGALAHHGLNGIGAVEKNDMRALVMRGGPWSASERLAILDYCESDTTALARLLAAMTPKLDLDRALLRGRYMAAAAHIEHNGIPIDIDTLGRLRDRWSDILGDLVATIDADYGVYEGRTFKTDRFLRWLKQNGIPWEMLPSGRPSLTDDTFREMARAYPAVATLRELRHALSDLRLGDLAVGKDGRNRTLLSAFRAKSGRNQPSNTKSIFGPSVWLRGLIKPPPGYGVAYIDWAQQEFGIAAALSGDPNMMAAYRSGDPYMAFAIQARAAPTNATKHTHKDLREQFKACVLAVQYGMEAESLSLRIAQPVIRARELLRLHREAYRQFWRWSDAAVDRAMIYGSLQTVFGWRIRISADANPRSLRNFPMQANGAEMLRLACIFAIERKVEICAPVHDALLVCAPLDRLENDILATQDAMREASQIVLGGFALSTDASAVVRYPHRYGDPRGKVMWERVMRLSGSTKRASIA